MVQPDAELQVLAMQTLLRMDIDLLGAKEDLIVRLRGELARVASAGSGDSRFFARQCLEHIDRVTRGPIAAGPIPSRPGSTTKRLQVPTELADLGALSRAASEREPQARTQVLAALASNGPVELTATALTALVGIGQPEDLPAVAPFLKHSDPRVRANAVEAIEAIAPAESRAPLLLPLMADPVDRVRANAIKALGALGEDAVFAALEGMLASSAVGTRASAVWALRCIRGDRAIQLLWKAARDPLEPIRLRVVEACRIQRHPQAKEILRRLSNDIDISIAEAAYGALAEAALPPPAPPPPPVAAAAPIAPVSAPAEGAAHAPATPTHKIPMDATLGLAPAAPEVPQTPEEALTSADPDVQLRALKEIESKDMKSARAPVIALAESAKDPVIIARAIATLGHVGEPSDSVVAIRFLSNPNDRVRANAVETVAMLATGEVVVRTLTPLADDRNNRVRGNVVRALAQLGVSGMDDRVDEMIVHADLLMRLSGAWAAGFLHPPVALKLLGQAARDSEADVRKVVVQSLGRLPAGREVAELARELGADTSAAVSTAARDLLEKLGPIATKPTRVTDPGIMPIPEPDQGKGGTSPSSPPKGEHSPNRTQPIHLADLAATVAQAPAPSRVRPSVRKPAPAKSEGRSEVLALDGELDDIYERLDGELEAMGRTIFELQEKNVISEPVFSKASYHVKRYADLYRKRQEAGARGFLARLPFFRKGAPDAAGLELEENLREEYRKLGETAIELYHKVERSFPPLAAYYERVEILLRQAKELKDRKP